MAGPLVSTKRLTRDDYTVAWICALPIEKAATRNMLDELHHSPPQPESDKNIYTFGSICGHNVVVVCQGDMGTTAAATVATRMTSTFRKLRFGLLVGIAGGVPDGRDVRLGDVVVSKGDGRSGGVVVHDRGKATPAGFESRPFLNGVPELLRNAFTELESRLLDQGSKIAAYISEAATRNYRFSEFKRPTSLTDNLFRSNYTHANLEDKTCAECNKDYIMARDPRDGPLIHFGIVASGNQVIKDSSERASILAAHPGVLAIEMEAAGLMDIFHCATIRGICDYADSHKNDGWHKYASATAAAVAKEILEIIPRLVVDAAPEVAVPELRNKHYLVPHSVSPTFTGRDDICQRLKESCLPSGRHTELRVQKRFVLYGLGGSGKTQVCLKFAQDHRESFWGVFWIDASSSETVMQGFLDIARVCGLEADIQVVKRWLSNTKDPWLLIIDNADNPEQDVSEYFPTGDRGVILLTTRNPDCEIHATVGSSKFGRMESGEAITLLLRTTGMGDISHRASRNLARPIVETLGYLALAVVQAGAAIRQKLCSIEEYCSVYSRRRKQLLSHQPIQAGTNYKYTVYTTWEVSFNMIENMSSKTARNAIEILQLFSFMHFDGIFEEILKEAWKNMHSKQLSDWMQSHQLHVLHEDDSKEWDPYTIREAVALLKSSSLISTDTANSRISMHPLVHMWTRDRLVEAEQRRCWTIAASTLGMSISWRFRDSDYKFRKLILPHIGSCLSSHHSRLFVNGEGELERFTIATRFALVYRECGRFQEAMELSEMVLEARKKTLGEEHPDTLASMENLANSYSGIGRRQEAMEMREKVLEASERTLGEEHPGTLTLASNLAISYSHLGRSREAMKLWENVLGARKRTLGEEHPDTLASMDNLASSYNGIGRRQEAMEMREKALEASKRMLGEEHPDTLTLASNLAISYSHLGRSREAMKLLENVLEARKRTLGEEHPDTLASIDNLASSYSNIGRRQEAMEMREKALEASKRMLGEEHPNTLTSMDGLAFSYIGFGQMREAMGMGEKVLEARKRLLGKEHPDTLTSINRLAVSYSYLGRSQEAMELFETAIEARKRILGEEHPDTLTSINDLAISYSDIGRSQETIDLGEKVLEARKRTLGEEHPDTLVSINSLAVWYSNLGRRQEATELREVLKTRKRTLGGEHPNTPAPMRKIVKFTSVDSSRSSAVEGGAGGEGGDADREVQ